MSSYSFLSVQDHTSIVSKRNVEIVNHLQIFSVKKIAVKPGLHISRKNRKHMVVNTFFKLSRYALVFT